MFWNRFSDLCISVGMSPNAVAKELKIPSGSITAWKNGVTPRPLTVKKIADFFGVNVEYVLYGGYPEESERDEKSPAPEGAEPRSAKERALESIKEVASTEDLLEILSAITEQLKK